MIACVGWRNSFLYLVGFSEKDPNFCSIWLTSEIERHTDPCRPLRSLPSLGENLCLLRVLVDGGGGVEISFFFWGFGVMLPDLEEERARGWCLVSGEASPLGGREEAICRVEIGAEGLGAF